MYDGASAIAEARLMAVRANRQLQIACGSSCRRPLHPHYRKVALTTAANQGLQFEELPYCTAEGVTLPGSLDRYAGQDITALVIQQPNFFGVSRMSTRSPTGRTRTACCVIAVVNPTSLALLKPPGEWGAKGADIAVGEGQPLGVPLSSGGPYLGFMTSRMEYVRQMPGRIVGRTLDFDGRAGFTLTLQAREQHIRRAKATSNICTNQGLLMTAATIYLSLMGPQGLERTAAACTRARASSWARSARVPGVQPAFSGGYFHEAVLQLDRPVAPVLKVLAARGILGGLDLGGYYPELGHALLVCATETKTSADIERYARRLDRDAAAGACRLRRGLPHAHAPRK